MITGRLVGKVAVVTASTQGIGYAIAHKLGTEGAKVVVSSRRAENVACAVESLQKAGLTVEGTTCHVGKEEDRRKLVDFALNKYGGIDLFVNNAATNPHFGYILDCDEQTWDKIFDINVKAGFMMSKLVVPELEKRGGGSIIFVSSITGYVPFQGIMPYGISKTAVIALTKSLAVSLAHKKIRVNCIAPGVIKTDFSRALWDSPDKAVESFYDEMIPMRRLGNPEDCSGAVAFLCSDDAKYITGETVMMSGGINCRL